MICASLYDCEEFIKAAGIPFALSPSTWSFMSAIKGDTTTVTPSVVTAGIWKHILLPPPVGISTRQSFLS